MPAARSTRRSQTWGSRCGLATAPFHIPALGEPCAAKSFGRSSAGLPSPVGEALQMPSADASCIKSHADQSQGFSALYALYDMVIVQILPPDPWHCKHKGWTASRRCMEGFYRLVLVVSATSHIAGAMRRLDPSNATRCTPLCHQHSSSGSSSR